MIPIRDEIPTRRVPVVNYLLIAVNILVFVWMWLAGPSEEAVTLQFAMIPSNFTNGVDVGDIIVLGLWFVLQLFSGVLSLGGPEAGGVAFRTHIGGFVAGVVMAKLLPSRRRPGSAMTWQVDARGV